jgi:hypothetical protein
MLCILFVLVDALFFRFSMDGLHLENVDFALAILIIFGICYTNFRLWISSDRILFLARYFSCCITVKRKKHLAFKIRNNPLAKRADESRSSTGRINVVSQIED